ncbi:ATP-dependent DNA helicase [Bombella apis]|uniref:ATP-dependent DNA helicase n=1 Tax=Bombella apis TaxID=1785988 RepID=UPI0012B940A1|nr:DEAD/DEAH box helicase [Bombella apis]MPW00435.1 AAA family ATPase [Bombella apis]
MKLTDAQTKAMAEIMASFRSGSINRHLLTGYAGSGKTTLMRALCTDLKKQSQNVVVSAPTHKAVSVLKGKVPGNVPCVTVQSLLSLEVRNEKHKTVLRRSRRPREINADMVVIDECSMLSEELMGWINRLLPGVFVLFLGDPAQLPPVGEEKSLSFDVMPCSHLDTIIRQAEGNPILAAATDLRQQQESEAVSFAWAQSDNQGGLGMYCPANHAADGWLQKAFLSPAFQTDNDEFRYICWTNKRVAEINSKVRRWRYGQEADLLPFLPGERAIARSPVWQGEGQAKRQVITTNEEVAVIDIMKSHHVVAFKTAGEFPTWRAEIPSWKVTLQPSSDGAEPIIAHMVRDQAALERVIERLKQEAVIEKERWYQLFLFKGTLLSLQHVYAMTSHTAQGSTFRNVFVDVGDIRRRERSNKKEMLQLFYVALTRASEKVILLGRS